LLEAIVAAVSASAIVVKWWAWEYVACVFLRTWTAKYITEITTAIAAIKLDMADTADQSIRFDILPNFQSWARKKFSNDDGQRYLNVRPFSRSKPYPLPYTRCCIFRIAREFVTFEGHCWSQALHSARLRMSQKFQERTYLLAFANSLLSRFGTFVLRQDGQFLGGKLVLWLAIVSTPALWFRVNYRLDLAPIDCQIAKHGWAQALKFGKITAAFAPFKIGMKESNQNAREIGRVSIRNMDRLIVHHSLLLFMPFLYALAAVIDPIVFLDNRYTGLQYQENW
jgi:hypothetical protein